jgi:hypothetical protein
MVPRRRQIACDFEEAPAAGSSALLPLARFGERALPLLYGQPAPQLTPSLPARRARHSRRRPTLNSLPLRPEIQVTHSSHSSNSMTQLDLSNGVVPALQCRLLNPYSFSNSRWVDVILSLICDLSLETFCSSPFGVINVGGIL